MYRVDRRNFLLALSAAMATPIAGFAAAKGKSLLSFSTLGCPKWDWKTILGNAAQWGFSGIELRGIQAEMDLTQRPEFAPNRIQQSRAELREKNLKITNLGSSARMHEPDPVVRAKQLDEGKRFIDLAQSLKAPYIRVFGDKYVEGEPKEKTIERIVAGLKELGAHAKGSGVSVLIESHGDFPDSATLKRILESVNLPNVALLWDAHHTCVAGKETPADTYQAVGRQVRHVHLKDSVPKGTDRQYVLTGKGDVPVKETVRVLAQNGYKGYYNLEWEKTWIPELEEPEIVFPQFAQVMKEYLAAVRS
jgi:sugar phosphate isomerase/epimerase